MLGGLELGTADYGIDQRDKSYNRLKLTIQVLSAGLSCGTFLRRAGVGDETRTLAYFRRWRVPFGKTREATSDRKVYWVLLRLRRGLVEGHGGGLTGS
jgi:hypothetical protein